MKTAVIGPGSMGLLFGGKLSRNTEVILIGSNAERVRAINNDHITIKRDGQAQTYSVRAFTGGTAEGPVDLIILFTKAYITRRALEQNAQLIGENTLILTLQNGAGHEEILQEFVPKDRILLGTTNQGSYRESANVIVHSGLGETTIGSLTGNETHCKAVQSLLSSSGFPCTISQNIRFTVWNKLMINASSSVLSGVLGVRTRPTDTRASMRILRTDERRKSISSAGTSCGRRKSTGFPSRCRSALSAWYTRLRTGKSILYDTDGLPAEESHLVPQSYYLALTRILRIRPASGN